MNNGFKQPAPEGWVEILWNAMAEDLGSGDPTTALFDEDQPVNWYIETQAEGVICGLGIAAYLMQPEADEPDSCQTDLHACDGDYVKPGTTILSGRLTAAKLLTKERTALNFLMQLSGVATLTHQFVQKVTEYDVKIVDTRKTTPGLRYLQKYAVRCGGGTNHRMGLYDGIMLKDNHIKAAGSITEAVRKAKSVAGHMTLIEVECESTAMVDEAVAAGANIVMLDNMDPFQMHDIVKAYKGKVILEASGGITLDTVRGVAQTGVDAISVGALTHSAKSLAIHLEVE
ncbi:MAG: carboxylating nicotinate-nucleotide diphosphorylase [Fimbriimonadaceae bacterium]